jgi:PKD repeat protein
MENPIQFKLNNIPNILLIAGIFLMISCKKEPEPTLSDPPTQADADFSYTPTAANPNIVDFSAANPSMTCIWDLGNGISERGPNVTASYPNAGTYTVTLSVFNQGGSATSSKDIVMDQSDMSLLDNPLYNFLTGGINGPGSKTWVIDSASATHFGVGPDPIGPAGNYPEWWAAGPNEKPGCGLYDDRYIFYLNNFQFDMVNNGDVYVNHELAGDFPGSFENLSDYTAPYSDQLNENWTLTEGTDTVLSVSGSSFIGFWTGLQNYRVIAISDTSLWLQYAHHSGGLLWYLRLIPE